MRFKDLQETQPNFYQSILEMIELLTSEGSLFDQIDIDMDTVQKDAALATVTDIEGRLTEYEELFRITPTGSEDDRRAVVIALYRGQQKLSASRIKEIALAYQNGEVDVTFANSTISVTFTSIYGVPPNFDIFEEQIETLKPAHLGLQFILTFITWNELDTAHKTWDELDALNMTWDEFEIWQP